MAALPEVFERVEEAFLVGKMLWPMEETTKASPAATTAPQDVVDAILSAEIPEDAKQFDHEVR